MNNTKIGQFICEKRKSLGLTQQELAEKLQITNKAVSKWETGDGMPDIQLLTPLANELGITVDEILNGEEISSEEIVPSAILSYSNDLPVGVVVTCILAFAVALYNVFQSFIQIVQFTYITAYGETLLEKLPYMLISFGFGIYWILVSIIFMCRVLKIFDYSFKIEKTMTIVAFIAGFVMLFAQGLDYSPVNYGMFFFSFALLLGTFHGYRVPHKVFYGLVILATCVFGVINIVNIVGYYENPSTDAHQTYAFVSRLVKALIFYIFYGLLEKFSSEYESVKE